MVTVRRCRLVAAWWVGVVMGCASGSNGASSGWPATAPARALVGGFDVQLEVEAWRSHQPVAGESGDPLIAVLRLKGDRAIPAEMEIGRVRMTHAGDVWTTVAKEEQPREPGASVVEFMVREGPRWPTGDSIEVQAQVNTRGTTTPTTILGIRTVLARVN